jgi:hypothetical protein
MEHDRRAISCRLFYELDTTTEMCIYDSGSLHVPNVAVARMTRSERPKVAIYEGAV